MYLRHSLYYTRPPTSPHVPPRHPTHGPRHTTRSLQFYVAEQSFYRWSLIVTPGNVKSLLHYALVLQCVKDNFPSADKFYQRALEKDPDNEQVCWEGRLGRCTEGAREV